MNYLFTVAFFLELILLTSCRQKTNETEDRHTSTPQASAQFSHKGKLYDIDPGDGTDLTLVLDSGFQCENADSMMEDITSMTDIKEVTSLFVHNHSTSFKCFPIGKFKNLTFLYWHGPVKEWPTEFFELKSLRSFYAIKGGLKTLPDGFLNLTKLESLYLEENEFSNIPKILLKMVALDNVGLGRNKINRIPKSFTHPVSLKTVNICMNPVTNEAMVKRSKADTSITFLWCNPNNKGCEICM